MIRLSIVLLFIGGVTPFLSAQEIRTDTLPPSPLYKQDSIIGFRTLQEPEAVEHLDMVYADHNPQKAAWYSAVIPGLGQAYNKKYWKIPLIWAGIGAFAYFIDYNNDLYQFYRKNLIYEVAGNVNGFINETPLEESTLKSARDQFRRTRDQLIIFGVIFYMLNIVDAHVDAHLIEFDVNQSLSVQLEPSIQSNPNGKQSTGLSLKFSF
jgi:uncharacterized protein DUF5683